MKHFGSIKKWNKLSGIDYCCIFRNVNYGSKQETARPGRSSKNSVLSSALGFWKDIFIVFNYKKCFLSVIFRLFEKVKMKCLQCKVHLTYSNYSESHQLYNSFKKYYLFIYIAIKSLLNFCWWPIFTEWS